MLIGWNIHHVQCLLSQSATATGFLLVERHDTQFAASLAVLNGNLAAAKQE